MAPVDLDAVWCELERGKIYECSLSDPTMLLDGLQMGDSVYIDPRPAILETLIHELLHRMRPRWGERRVASEARRLLPTDQKELARWWAKYKRTRILARPLSTADAE